MFDDDFRSQLLAFLMALVIFFGIYFAFFYPPVKIWVAEQSGLAALKKAKFEKQIQIEDAKGKRDSAVLLAEAEIERAKGIAKANEIINNSLTDRYLKYKFIDGLKDGQKEIIYVPTEANLPILEAGNRKRVNETKE